MESNFPITVSIAPVAVLGTVVSDFFFLLIALILSFSFFGESIFILVVIVVALIFIFKANSKLFAKKIVLNNDSVLYNFNSKTYNFFYKDVQKIGYYYKYRPGRGGGVNYQELQIYLTNSIDPIKIDIYGFSLKDILNFLRIILSKNPKVLVGESVEKALNSGYFPRNIPFITMFGTEGTDTKFSEPSQAATLASGISQVGTSPVKVISIVLYVIVMLIAIVFFFAS